MQTVSTRRVLIDLATAVVLATAIGLATGAASIGLVYFLAALSA
jgi:hypothetical protein